MPTLAWPGKHLPLPSPGRLTLDSRVYPQGRGYPDAPVLDRLIQGDNLRVMSALLPEYEGRFRLIYADPPFFTNRSYPARVGQGEDSRRPQEWQLADGYPDAWPDLDSYLEMLYPRLHLMHRLLAADGVLYLHLDWHANSYARLLLDEIFGAERLLNEIIWVYHGPSPIRSAFNRKHDTILVYTKSAQYTFNVDAVRAPYNPNTVRTFASSPRAGFGKVPDLARGKVPEDWWYFPVVARLHRERTGYPTQKPEALLERILRVSSNQGDLVGDFFCGSGTLPAVAARLGRRFIAADLTWRAIHTCRSRLVSQAGPPFSIEHEAALPAPGEVEQPQPAAGLARRRGPVIRLDSALAQTLDYWEVDPDWRPGVFLSAAQALRPRKKQPIPAEITLSGPPGGQTAVRLAGVNGLQRTLLLDEPA